MQSFFARRPEGDLVLGLVRAAWGSPPGLGSRIPPEISWGGGGHLKPASTALPIGSQQSSLKPQVVVYGFQFPTF